MAALLPFGKVADFLGELLPLSARATAGTERNRPMKVGKRLKKSAEGLATGSSMDRTILQMWLKSGYMEKHVLHETLDGTPQGGIIPRSLIVRWMDLNDS